jgi:CHAT domain-containing protein
LPLLPGTKLECQRIAQAFAATGSGVQLLLGREATEKNVTLALPGRGLIHLAAHGLVDERPGNLFGGIALAPPAEGQTASDDGLLSYAEILDLPLKDCELAILSACQTNVGPERPLEAGATLVQAFLSAGAHRVVASQWSVNDESTAELMGGFLEAIATQRKSGRPVNYAEALSAARRRLRASEKWSAPYHWAPFILVGTAQAARPTP